MPQKVVSSQSRDRVLTVGSWAREFRFTVLVLGIFVAISIFLVWEASVAESASRKTTIERPGVFILLMPLELALL